MPNAIEELLRVTTRPCRSPAVPRWKTSTKSVAYHWRRDRASSVFSARPIATRRSTRIPNGPNIMRQDVRPLSFGGGIHYCVGAQLARIEGEIAIATQLRRLSNLQLDDIEHPDWRQTFVLRSLNKLPASW